MSQLAGIKAATEAGAIEDVDGALRIQQRILTMEAAQVTINRNDRMLEHRRIQEIIGTPSIKTNPSLTTSADRTAAQNWYNLLAGDTIVGEGSYEKALRVAHNNITKTESNQLAQLILNLGSPAAIEMLHAIGHDDDILPSILQSWERDRDPACFAPYGDFLLEENRPTEATLFYQRTAVLNLTDAALMYRLGVALSRTPTTRSLGTQLIAYSPLLVLGDFAQALRLADAMRRFDTPDHANQWFDAYIARFTIPPAAEYAQSQARARDAATAKGDYARAPTPSRFPPPTSPPPWPTWLSTTACAPSTPSPAKTSPSSPTP